ncbi:MAG: hypothetical protein OXI33_17025 [Chloroflexota bacterium]|nr:hypothetical protein [Chloroflexota bacterium]
MHTREASLRLPAIIICIAAVLGMVVACGDSNPWKNPCIHEETTTMIEDTDAEEPASERPSDEYMLEVRDKYWERIRAFPNYVGVGVGDFQEFPSGKPLDGYGITIYLTESVDFSAVPEDKRIPECLDGVPVRFQVHGRIELLGG